MRDGLRYVRRHRLLAPLVVVIGLSWMCFSGPVATGLVLLAGERGWGAVGTGWVASAFSVGATASALLLTVAPRVPRAGAAALLVTAPVGLGQAPSLTVAVAFGALIGLTSGFATTLTGVLVQTATPPLPRPRHLGHHPVHPRPGPGALPRRRHHRGALGRGHVLRRLRRDLPARRCARPRRPGAAAGELPELRSA